VGYPSDSLDLQKRANDGLIEQNQQAKEMSYQQKESEKLRSFESTFYSLAEVARKEYERFEITKPNGATCRGSLAVTAIEDKLQVDSAAADHHLTLSRIFDSLDDESGMGIFSVVRSFYILLRVTVDRCPPEHREQYIDICVYSMPIKLIHLVCLAKVFTEWDNMRVLTEYGFFSRPGIEEYVNGWTLISQQEP